MGSKSAAGATWSMSGSCGGCCTTLPGSTVFRTCAQQWETDAVSSSTWAHPLSHKHTEFYLARFYLTLTSTALLKMGKLWVDAGLQTSALQELPSKTQSTHGVKATLSFSSSLVNGYKITCLALGAQILPQCVFRSSALWFWPGTLHSLTGDLRYLMWTLPC